MPKSRVALVLLLVSAVIPQVSLATQTNPYFKNNQNQGDMVGFAVSGNSPGSVGVAFVGNAASGGFAGIYSKPSGGGVLLTLTGSNFSAAPVGPIVTDGTSVVFRGLDQVSGGTNNGVFSAPVSGGVVLTIRGSSFADPSYAPNISPNGNIAFKDLQSDGSTTGIFAQSRDGGVRLTINGSGFARMGRPAINTALNVAFVGTTALSAGTPVSNIYVQRPDQVAPVPLPSSPSLRITGDQVAIAGSPQATSVSFSAIDSTTGVRGIYHSDRFTPQGGFSVPQLVIGDSATEALGDVFSTNSSGEFLTRKGYQYYMAKSDMNAAGVLPNDPIRLIGIGDSVDGSTVTDIMMSESSLLDSGDAVLHLSLSDGTSGFYVVSVPEPTSIFALLATSPALLARRRR